VDLTETTARAQCCSLPLSTLEPRAALQTLVMKGRRECLTLSPQNDVLHQRRPFSRSSSVSHSCDLCFPANTVLATSSRLLTPPVPSSPPISASALSHHQLPLPNSRRPAKNLRLQSRTSAQTSRTLLTAFAPLNGTLFDMALILTRLDDGASWSRVLGTKSRT